MARKLVGDLQPGDLLFLENGQAAEVVSIAPNPIFEAPQGKVMEIEMDDGSRHLANSLDAVFID